MNKLSLFGKVTYYYKVFTVKKKKVKNILTSTDMEDMICHITLEWYYMNIIAFYESQIATQDISIVLDEFRIFEVFSKLILPTLRF